MEGNYKHRALLSDPFASKCKILERNGSYKLKKIHYECVFFQVRVNRMPITIFMFKEKTVALNKIYWQKNV